MAKRKRETPPNSTSTPERRGRLPFSRTLRRVLVTALPSIAYAIGVWYASKALLKLSGNALWLPFEWRRTVEVLGVTFGVLVFGLAVHVSHRTSAAAEHGAAPTADHAASERSRYRRALVFMGGALLALFVYVGLRRATVVDWTPPQWYVESHRGRPLPSFVDLEHGTFFLPLVWPEELERHAESVRQLPDFQSTPIQYLLDHAPQELIDLVEAHAKTELLWTTWAFLALHLVILALTSLALGSSFSVAGTLGKLLSTH